MYTYIHICINICIHKYTCTYNCVNIYIYIYVHIYIHIYIQVYICMYKCVSIFVSVSGVFKCTLYVRVNTSVGAHACVRVRDMSTHTRTLYRVVLEQNA